MEIWALNLLAELFKERLEALGMKQKDLLDDKISAATLSNLATGKRRVGRSYVVRIFNKLGIKEEELPLLLSETKLQEKEDNLLDIQIRMRSIENTIDFVGPDQGIKELKEIGIEKDHPYLSLKEYLIGKAYFFKSNWKKACDHFQYAIQIYDQHPKLAYTNIKSACLYNLSRICYRENDFSQALNYVNKGLDEFVTNGERFYDKYNLLIAKVIYLEKLERNDEAMEILFDLEQDSSTIDTEVKLNMYQMMAFLYNKKKMLKKSIHYAEIGIDLARREKNYDRSFELWTTLASAYQQIGDLSKAKICLKTASSFENKIRRKFLSIYNSIQLGKLYEQEGNYTLAQSTLEEAVQRGSKENEALFLSQALNSLGDCLVKQKLGEQAIENYLKAYQIAQKHSFLSQERDIAMKLALYYKGKDLMEYNKFSARHFDLSVELAKYGGGKMELNEQILHLLTDRQTMGDPPDN